MRSSLAVGVAVLVGGLAAAATDMTSDPAVVAMVAAVLAGDEPAVPDDSVCDGS